MSDNLKDDYGYKKKDMSLTQNLDIIKLLIEEGLDIDSWGIVGHTAVHSHAKYGNFEIVKYLISKGADINKKNIYGDNIFDDTLKCNEMEIYKYLIEKRKYQL